MRSPLPEYNAVVASARPILPKRKWKPTYTSWQETMWDYFERLGEFGAAVMWRANTMSRVRLVAAELSSTGEEPKVLETGPAAELVARLAGGTGGQAQLMREMTIHLSVPGEGWVVGEDRTGLDERWFVASAQELRTAPNGITFQLREGENERADWRDLARDSMVLRVWNPDPRYGWRASSDSRRAMDAMTELDLINKRIIAEIISRLSSNGILLYDKQRLSFPPSQQNPNDATSVDPFAEILVAVAGAGIKDPTSPEATIPIPIGFDPGDMANVDPKTLLQHVRLAEFLDEKLILERDSAVKRVATSLDMPSEVLLGTAGQSHWGAWQVEEAGLKIHIAPQAELMCYSLTEGYLHPALKLAEEPMTGPNGGKVVVWYDPSEITVRPDKSSNTIAVYDRGETTGDALRRETGLNIDGDKPTPADTVDWIKKFVGRQPQTAPQLLQILSDIVLVAPEPETAPEDATPEQDDTGTTNMPDTQEDDRPDDDTGPPAGMSTDRLLEMSALINQELASRLPKRSNWVHADEPDKSRVTPVRRNNREPAEV